MYNTLGEESTCHVDIIEKKKWEVSLRKMLEEWNARRNSRCFLLEEWNARRNSPMLFA
jgi:hypothetical protein